MGWAENFLLVLVPTFQWDQFKSKTFILTPWPFAYCCKIVFSQHVTFNFRYKWCICHHSNGKGEVPDNCSREKWKPRREWGGWLVSTHFLVLTHSVFEISNYHVIVLFSCFRLLSDMEQTISLTVYHRNLLGLDEFLGSVVLPLKQFQIYERPKNR